jgi:hypothetical protein
LEDIETVYHACHRLSEDRGFRVEVVYGEAPSTGGHHVLGESPWGIDALSNQIATKGGSGSTAFHALPAGRSVVDDEAVTDLVFANPCSD